MVQNGWPWMTAATVAVLSGRLNTGAENIDRPNRNIRRYLSRALSYDMSDHRYQEENVKCLVCDRE
jgi:hypothetical protein